MLPSTLYFKSIPCPFGASGLCRRPHCHLKHEISPATDKAIIRLPKRQPEPPSSYVTTSSTTFENPKPVPLVEQEPVQEYHPTPIDLLPKLSGSRSHSLRKKSSSSRRPAAHAHHSEGRSAEDEKAGSEVSSVFTTSMVLRCRCDEHKNALDAYLKSPKLEETVGKFLQVMDELDRDLSDLAPPPLSAAAAAPSSPMEDNLANEVEDRFSPSSACSEERNLDDDLRSIFDSIQPVPENTVVKAGEKVENSMDPTAELEDSNSSGKKRVAHHEEIKSLSSVKKKRAKLTASQLMMSRFAATSTNSKPTASRPLLPTRERNAFSKPSFTSDQTAATAARQARVLSAKAKEELPVIPAQASSSAGGVSFSMRQKYLKLIHKECEIIHKLDKTEARQQAVSREQSCLEQSGHKKAGYINAVVKCIQALRSEAKLLLLHVATNGKNQVRNHNNQMLVTHSQVLYGKKGTIGTWSMEKTSDHHKNVDHLPDAEFYSLLSRYLMTDEQLNENGYPMMVAGKPGVVECNDSRPKNPQPSDKTKRRCDRCRRVYSVDHRGHQVEEEECVYHWGRKFRSRGSRATGPISSYSCCQGDALSDGCQVSSKHFADVQDEQGRFGFVKTMPSSSEGGRGGGVYALDCEMCSTTVGNELTRVTVVNLRGQTVYESMVMPDNDVIDYNTRFSGITEEHLQGVRTKLRDVQAVLLSKFSAETILVGHSLESDLKVLKLIHGRVVDTSLVFPHKFGLPYKRALKNLAAEHLTRIIQDSVDGHDSAEDAIAALDLMKLKLKEDYVKLCQNVAKS